jgi:hypothetical protein
MQPPQIEYAPAPAFRKRRAIRRGLILLIIVCAGVPLGFLAGPRAWRLAKLIYVQRRVMRYAAPQEEIVYDDIPADATRLLKTSSEYFRFTRGPIGRFPGAWSEFDPPSRTCAVLFLHELLTPDGERRLVVVTAFAPAAVDRMDFGPEIYLESFGDVDASANYRVTVTQGISFLPYNGKSRDLRIFAGQPDSADASRFSIRFVANGIENFLDGRLKDGGGVYLELRK